jgi:hypothetical protein
MRLVILGGGEVVLGLLFWVRKRVFVSDFGIKRIKKVLIINGIALGRGKAYRRFDLNADVVMKSLVFQINLNSEEAY